MALVLRELFNKYDAFYKLGEENNGSPLPLHLRPHMILLLFAVYLWVVKDFGPKLMANRKPFNLRSVMLAYNAMQVVFNTYIWVFAIRELMLQDDPLIRNCIRSTPMMLHLNKMYLLNKITDLIETLIFVLRKKTQQVSFLHVYHHLAVITGCYLATMVAPATESVVTGTLNAMVHTAMYCYYFMSIYDAQLVAQFQTVKQRLTQIQLVQFALICIHMSKSLFGVCDFPKALALTNILQNLFLVCLFSDFYYRTYLTKRPNAQTVVKPSPVSVAERTAAVPLTSSMLRRSIVVNAIA